jgi:hypothetical protein
MAIKYLHMVIYYRYYSGFFHGAFIVFLVWEEGRAVGQWGWQGAPVMGRVNLSNPWVCSPYDYPNWNFVFQRGEEVDCDPQRVHMATYCDFAEADRSLSPTDTLTFN